MGRDGAVGFGIRLFDIVLRVLGMALAVASVAAVPLVLLFVTGRGPVRVPAELQAPYRISFLDESDRSIVVGSDRRIDVYRNFEIGEESRYLEEPPGIRLDVEVDRTDTDTRAVMAASAVALLLLAWTAVWNLGRVVRSAVAGDPFVPESATRLRRLAASVVGLPLLGMATSTALGWTLENDPPVDVVQPGLAWWSLVVVGIAVLALAEVFRSGSQLRQFERETI